MNILICDDEKAFVETIIDFFTADCFFENAVFFRAYNGHEALEHALNNKLHLMIIDVMMPLMDGYEAVKKIKQKQDIPVIFLSARSEIDDKILGLQIGADDYMVKPFDKRELIARAQVQLRKGKTAGGKNCDYVNGGLFLDEKKAVVTLNDEIVELTATEFRILQLLMKNIGKTFSAYEIYKSVWGHEPNIKAGQADVVYVHLTKIRKKIEPNPKKPIYLKVVYGVGIKIERI